MTKKAAADEWLEQIPHIILTIVVLTIIFVLINMYVNMSIDPDAVQVQTFYNRIYYSPTSIMLSDAGRVHPGLIEMDQFTNESLDRVAAYTYERQISAKFEILNSESKMVKTAYYNGLWYGRLEPLAKAELTGAGSAKIYYKIAPIVYRLNGVDNLGYLKTSIILPN
jgi:hypothetical protein